MSTTKQYSVGVKRVPSLPRNARLRLAKAGAAYSRVLGAEAAGDAPAPSALAHTHDNKAVLDRLSVAEGYMLIKGVELAEQDGEVAAQAVERKARAGYADEAGALGDWSEGDRRYVSKTADDRVEGVLTMDKRVEFGAYVPGASGGVAGMAQDGSLVEVDYLRVRRKAQFSALEVAEAKAVGGKLVVSPGDGAEIASVERAEGGWLCRYKCDERGPDGAERRIEGKFRAGDQVYCASFNLAGAQRWWWRLCIDAGDGWLVLSEGDCAAGSDEPAAGDKCAQLGNRSDASRQSAIVLSSSEPGGSPLLALYGGIDGYSLEDRDQVSMGAGIDGLPYIRVYGQAYIGDRGGAGYLLYDPAGGLDVKGRISAESSVGSQSLSEYVESLAWGAAADDGVLTPPEKREALGRLERAAQEFEDAMRLADEAGEGGSGAARACEDAYHALRWYLLGEASRPLDLLLEDGGCLLLEDGSNIELDTSGVLHPLGEATAVDRDEYNEAWRAWQRAKDALPAALPVYDHTKTAIDGGIVTSGTVQLCGGEGSIVAGVTGDGEGGDAVRFWAGASFAQRANAPYKVTQAGDVYADKANIRGGVMAAKASHPCEIAADGQTLANAFYLSGAPLGDDDVPAYVLPELAAGEARTIEVLVVATSDSQEQRASDGGAVMALEGASSQGVSIIARGRMQDPSERMSVYGAVGLYRLTGFRITNDQPTYWHVSLVDGSVPQSAPQSPQIVNKPSHGVVDGWSVRYV